MRQPPIRLFSAATILVLGACSEPAPQPKTAEAPAEPTVRITQFYAASPMIGKGETTQLCYSVEGAETVRLSPPVEQVWPALSRCFEVRPTATTTYELTAADKAGHSVSNRATIEVGAARKAATTGNKRMIQEVTVTKMSVAPGEQVTICYTARNAKSVTITPGQGTRQSAERGCVTDRPAQTTTYRVVANGASGETDSERVVVKVR